MRIVLSLLLCCSALAPAADTKQTANYQRVKAALDAVPAIDTHDHLWPFETLPGYVQTERGHGMNLSSIWRNSYYTWFNPISPWPPGGKFDDWWRKAKNDFANARATSFRKPRRPAPFASRPPSLMNAPSTSPRCPANAPSKPSAAPATRSATASARTSKITSCGGWSNSAPSTTCPSKIHTGQARIPGSNPMLLVDLIAAHPKTKFILFHGGFPWVGETGVILMRHSSHVWIDSVWLPTLSYTTAKRAFHEWLEVMPSDRIMWGADCNHAEGIYGATEFTRRCLAEVLAEKIDRAELKEPHALRIGRQILRDNALALFPQLQDRLWKHKGKLVRVCQRQHEKTESHQMRIYIESTIPSYVVARPARDLLQAARQQLTRDWWELKREQHELFASQVVLDEIASGEAAMAKQRLALMSGIPVARATDEVEALTQSILDSGVLPANADRDAAHIALATVHEMDILLSWNCRHIANAFIQAKLRKLADAAGFTLPVIAPEELLENENEQNH